MKRYFEFELSLDQNRFILFIFCIFIHLTAVVILGLALQTTSLSSSHPWQLSLRQYFGVFIAQRQKHHFPSFLRSSHPIFTKNCQARPIVSTQPNQKITLLFKSLCITFIGGRTIRIVASILLAFHIRFTSTLDALRFTNTTTFLYLGLVSGTTTTRANTTRAWVKKISR